VITLTRNFGQTAAFAAGFDTAHGSIIATIDADLQNDPQDILEMIKMMQSSNADIVTGWRKKRNDPFVRSFMSKAANWLILKVMDSPVHDTGCSLRVYRKSVVKNLQLYGEMHRFIPILASLSGDKIVEMEVVHSARQFGESKYGLNRMFKVILDLVTLTFLRGFQTKPIYMFGFMGLWSIFLSVITGIFVVARHFFFGGIWLSPLFIIAIILAVFGIMSILMGLLAEIQVRTWYETSGKKGYVIKK
jgi:glycosyltransferase involved in cell wall biosynthesis